MAVPFSNTKLRVPKGFQNVLECLAREVLRTQPDNIHEFAAAYFEKMLKVRAETGHDPAVHGAKLEDRNYNNESFKKRSVDPSDPQQNAAALTIQTQFRQHSAKEEVGSMREEVAATRIQAGIRGYLSREEVRKMKGSNEEEVDIDLDDPDVEKAAIKIQAGFKGFKARKQIEGENEQVDSTPAVAPTEAPAADADPTAKEEEEIDLKDPETEKAALKIQAGFRGYQTRKDLKDPSNEAEATTAPPVEEEKPAEATEAPAQEAVDDASGAEKEKTETEEVSIDLDDPEMEKAATKIQAGFKGYKARREVKEKASAKDVTGETEAPKAEEPAAAEQSQAEGETTEAAPAPEVAEGQTAEAEGQAPQDEAQAAEEPAKTEEAKPATEAEAAPPEEAPQTEAQGEEQTEAAPAAAEGQSAQEGEGQAEGTVGHPGNLVHDVTSIPGLFYHVTLTKEGTESDLGLTVDAGDPQDYFKVMSMEEGGVAQTSGLVKVGDLITKVRDQPTSGMPEDEFTSKASIAMDEVGLELEIFRADPHTNESQES